jgi:predicted metal-dependent enzyme (double-stranded beta helix superfamily)
MGFPELPGRNLSRSELAELANDIAEQPGLWSHLMAFPADRRHYETLHRDEHVDAWLICWTADSDTGWHDHDGSAGAVRMVAGALTESNPRLGGAPAEKLVPAGTTLTYEPDHIHRLTGTAARSVSIHVYSPPLRRMGQYRTDESGLMRRVPIGYADELREADPLAVS